MSKDELRRATRGGIIIPGKGARRKARIERAEQAFDTSAALLINFNTALLHQEEATYLIAKAIADPSFIERWRARRKLRGMIQTFRARRDVRASSEIASEDASDGG